MNRKVPTYLELRDVASRAFREAVEELRLTKLQAFAFTYEHLGVFIEGEDAWNRLLAVTAAFKAGEEAKVELIPDSPFTDDVLKVLRTCYLREAPLELARRCGSTDDEDLQGDMAVVTTRFLEALVPGPANEH